jgi:hypothetical protein
VNAKSIHTHKCIYALRYFDFGNHSFESPATKSHFAYDIEFAYKTVTQQDVSVRDYRQPVLIVVRRLDDKSEDDASYLKFYDFWSFLKHALSQKRTYFWAPNAEGVRQ